MSLQFHTASHVMAPRGFGVSTGKGFAAPPVQWRTELGQRHAFTLFISISSQMIGVIA